MSRLIAFVFILTVFNNVYAANILETANIPAETKNETLFENSSCTEDATPDCQNACMDQQLTPVCVSRDPVIKNNVSCICKHRAQLNAATDKKFVVLELKGSSFLNIGGKAPSPVSTQTGLNKGNLMANSNKTNDQDVKITVQSTPETQKVDRNQPSATEEKELVLVDPQPKDFPSGTGHKVTVKLPEFAWKTGDNTLKPVAEQSTNNPQTESTNTGAEVPHTNTPSLTNTNNTNTTSTPSDSKVKAKLMSDTTETVIHDNKKLPAKLPVERTPENPKTEPLTTMKEESYERPMADEPPPDWKVIHMGYRGEEDNELLTLLDKSDHDGTERFSTLKSRRKPLIGITKDPYPFFSTYSFMAAAFFVYISFVAVFIYVKKYKKRPYTRIPLLPGQRRDRCRQRHDNDDDF